MDVLVPSVQCARSVEAALLDADVCVFVLRGSLLAPAHAPRARKKALRTSQGSLAGGFPFEVKIHAQEHIRLLVCNVQAHASTRARSDWHPCCWAQRKVRVLRRFHPPSMPCPFRTPTTLPSHSSMRSAIPRMDPNFSTCRCIPFECAGCTVPCTRLLHLHLLLLLLHHQHHHM